VVACLLLTNQAAQAGTNDILIGVEGEIAYGPDGKVSGPPGEDAALVMDVSNPCRAVSARACR
jgi:hypothetical protein